MLVLRLQMICRFWVMTWKTFVLLFDLVLMEAREVRLLSHSSLYITSVLNYTAVVLLAKRKQRHLINCTDTNRFWGDKFSKNWSGNKYSTNNSVNCWNGRRESGTNSCFSVILAKYSVAFWCRTWEIYTDCFIPDINITSSLCQ